MRHLDLEVRIGLHAGECEVLDGRAGSCWRTWQDEMVLMRAMRSPEGTGNCLPTVKGCVPVAGARFGGFGRLQSACARRGQALAGIGAPPGRRCTGGWRDRGRTARMRS